MSATALAPAPAAASEAESRHVRIGIVGAGFSGICMAIRLKQAGIEDFAIIERAEDLGGTWRDNTYPGCACDVPSHLYSYSFERNPDWGRLFAPQHEILDYLHRCALKYGIREHIRFGEELLSSSWDAGAKVWRGRTTRGEFTCDVAVSAVGGLTEPHIPRVPGLERFTGAMFHSARWDHDHDLAGERVAVIGTGASAAQFVPEIQPEVERLVLFQRTPPWVLPRPDRSSNRLERFLLRYVPGAQRLLRGGIFAFFESGTPAFLGNDRMLNLIEFAGRRHLRRQVPDRELRRRLRPSYRIGCKRIVLADNWYPALRQPNVDVVSSGLAEVRERSVVDADGVEHEVDAIIFGTGFQIWDQPNMSRLHGREGRSMAEEWDGFPQAYLGTAVAGFPNLFMLIGPNTGQGNNSVLSMVEAQVDYVLGAIEAMEREGVATVEVRRDVQEAFNAELQSRHDGAVWEGCRSWYLTEDGRNPTIWPGWTYEYWWRTRKFRPGDYELTPK
ncbi:MAG: flavin-containing monooxygenase [Solirubrobacterales bacterium]